MTPKVRNCFEAAVGLGPEDTARFVAQFEQYKAAGASPEDAGRSAAADLLADIAAEAKEIGELIGGMVEDGAKAGTLTEAQARQRFNWQDMGTKDGTKTHALFFSDPADDRPMRYGEVSLFSGSTRFQVDGGESAATLKLAKAEAERVAIAKLERDGYVGKATQATTSAPTDVAPKDDDSEAIRQAKADLMASMGELANLLGKNTRLNILPEQEQALMPELAKPAAAAVVQQAETLPQAKPEELTQDAPEESEAQETAESEKIANFGEKIGGSRADTAKPLGKRMTKEKDDRPAWARKYHAMPAAGTRISLAAMMSGQPQEAQPGDRWQLFAGEGSFVQPVSRTIYPSEQAALDAIPLVEVSRKHRVYAYKEGEKILWGIFRKMGDRKRTMVKGGFESEEAGMLALVADPVSIIEHKFAFPERPWLDNVERIGPARRTGNVTPTQFNETFGFRGGEFGKWNEGGDGQEVLNHAYDGLLDLANVLGLPPKAMSLNGELAIAFGARGKGGMKSGAAHYERDYEVMNLTKMQGAGSLAHEWFHALDHYLSRLDGKAFSTFTTNERGDRVRVVTKEADGNYLSHGALRKSNMRPELLEAFGKMIAALHGKPRQVPINVERVEKSVKSSAGSLDYRLNDLRGTIADGRYNRSKKTATPAQLAQWDALAERLRQGDLGEAKHIEAPSSARFSMGRQSTTVIVEMNGIYKAVTGRSFDKTGYDSIGNAIKQEATNLKALRASLADATERAARGEMATITQGSDYATNAREIDSGRVSPYWSTPHEMGARAFEAYIMDRIAERAGRSDYLVYGAENSYYALFGMKPYPEGDERRQINAAFDALFKTVEAKETDKGVALLSQSPAKPFYSALNRAIEGVAMKQGTAGAWGQFLKGMVASGKVKADELEWSGLSEWLNLQPGKVSKEQISDYLAANGVQVTETVLGESGLNVEGDLEVGQNDFGEWAVWSDLTDSPIGGTYETEADAIAAMEAMQADNPAKYSNYTLPGGTNYREVLLTLPVKADGPLDLSWRKNEDGKWAWFSNGKQVSGAFRNESDSEAARGSIGSAASPAGVYKSGHWDQPNVLAHIRVNDRTDADGKHVLFVEELQSDWGQAAKRKGFAGQPPAPATALPAGWTVERDAGQLTIRDAAGQFAGARSLSSWEDDATMMRKALETYNAAQATQAKGDGVPRAPFVTQTDKWLALALKRIVKMAVDEGYDRVAFVTGEQSAERYDLSKQVRSIAWTGRGNDTEKTVTITPNSGNDLEFMVQPDGAVGSMGRGSIGNEFDGKRLDEIVGKEVAERIMGQPYGDMRGNGLKVGGAGMVAFYDKIVPAALKDVLKKVGGGTLAPIDLGDGYRIETTRVGQRTSFDVVSNNTRDDSPVFSARTMGEAEDWMAEHGAKEGGRLTQPGFDITPTMRSKAADGLPLFKTKASTTGTDPGKLTAMVENIRAGWADAPPVTVVSTVLDLPIRFLTELRRANAMNTARALIVPNTGQVYLIADRLSSLADAQFVLFHEVLGHYGLRKFLGADYEKTMRQMRAMNAGLAAESRSWMAAYGTGQIEARVARGMSYAEATVEVDLLSVEEALADRAGNPEPISGFKRLVAKLQAWLREHGFMGAAQWLEGKTQAQVLSLLQSARDAVEKAEGVHAYTGGAMVALSQGSSRGPGSVSTGEPTVSEGGPNSGAGDAKALADLLEGQTFRLKGLGGLNIPAQRKVLHGVLALGDNLKVLRSVVEFVPVHVVDILARKNLPPESLFRNEAVLKELLSADLKGSVATAVDVADALVSAVTGVRAKGSETRAQMLARAGEGSAAARAGERDLAVGMHGGIVPRIKATGNSGAFDPSNPSILLSQHTPEQRDALKRAGIAPKRRMKDSLRSAWEAAAGLIADRTDLAQGARQAVLDQFYGIQRAVQRDVGNLPLEQDPYVTARLANGGTSSVMRALLLHGQAQWAANGQHLEKKPGTVGLLDILKPLGDDLNDWFGWMIGNRAARLFSEGRENNFTEDQIQALQALATPEKIVAFRRAAVQYAAFKRSVLDVAEAAGLINAETRPAWDNADYIPFYRQIDEKATFSATGKKGLAGQSSGIRTLKGGESALHDPIENLLMNFSRLIDASLKNNALSRTVRVLEDANSTALSKTGYTMSAEIVPRSQIEKALADAGTPDYILAGLPPEAFEGMAKMWAIQPPTDPSIIRIMRGGKPQFYKVHDPLLLKAATSFVPFDFPGLGVMRAFKRVLTAMVTSTPEFMLRNFIRDSAAVQGIARTGVNPAKSLSGIVRAFKEDGAAEHMLFAGASFQSGNTNAADPTGTATSIRRALRQKGMDAAAIDGFMATIVDKPARLWELYKHIGEAIENANREAIFEATARGGSVTAAAYEAKDLMDFSLRGSSPLYQLAADVLPFFNARVQGLYRVGRSNPARLAVYAGIMAALSVALVMANSGEDWYDELPDWDKDAYWHFMIGGTHFRIPKPFELGVAFATIPERIARYLGGQDAGSKTVGRLFANVRDQLAFDPIPQAIRPAMNVWANKDTFRGSPIENIADEGKMPHQRYSATTSPAARLVTDTLAPATDAIGLSPKKLEYLIGGYLGTVGTYAIGTADMVVRELQDAPPQPAPRLDDLPIVKAFVREAPARTTVYENDLYAVREHIEQVYRSASALAKEGKAKEAKAMLDEYAPEIKARGTVLGAAATLAGIRRERERVYADRAMTPEAKRERLDELQVLENKAVKKAMTNPKVKALQ